MDLSNIEKSLREYYESKVEKSLFTEVMRDDWVRDRINLITWLSKRETIKEDSMMDKIIQDREKTHGRFDDQAYTAQELKEMFYLHLKGDLSHVQKEALEMIFHKIARVASGNPDEIDHWLDIAGYALLVAGNLRGEENGTSTEV